MRIEPKFRRIILTILILFLGILAWTDTVNEVFINKTFLGRFDGEARSYLDRTITKSLVTYAVVRSLNGIISVIQESDVAVSPAGLGVSIAAGEILDPVNDLIERFSWVILASATSLGIQRVMMDITVWLGFRVLLTLSMAAFLTGLWVNHLGRWNLKSLGLKLLLLSVFIRFAVPMVAFATDRIDTLFLDQTYTRASEDLKDVSQAIENEGAVEKGNENQSSGWLRSLYDSLRTSMKVEERIRILKDTVSGYIDHIIDLIVVFILQTIIVPLIVLYILYRLTRGLLGNSWSERIHGFFMERTTGKVRAGEETASPSITTH